MSANKALKEQERTKKLEHEEKKLEVAELLLSATEHEGVKKLQQLLTDHVTVLEGTLAEQYDWVDDGMGGKRRERLTLRQIDQFVNTRDSYKEILKMFVIAGQQKESADKAIDKLSKK